MEEQQVDNSNRDICIGNIKHCAEEVTILTHQEAKERGATIPLEQGEVYHVDYIAHKEASILCIKQPAVKHTVDHVAYSTRQDKHSAHEDTHRNPTALQQFIDAVDDSSDHNQAEEAQGNLTPYATELHAVGKARVLDIAEVEPREDGIHLTHLHIGVNKHLDNLVENDEDNGRKSDNIAFVYTLQIHNNQHNKFSVYGRQIAPTPRVSNKFCTNIQNFKKICYFCATFHCPGGEMVDALVSGASA